MKTAVYCVSKNALKLAWKIKADKRYKADVYISNRIAEYLDNQDCIVMEDSLKDTVSRIFNSYALHIFITASGIAVRVIDGLLKSKDKDPAVLTADEQGNFVISLLSGHLGGANEECRYLAEILGSIPVITTASDTGGKIAVDMLSQKLGAGLADLSGAKKVPALIVNGEKVKLVLPENIILENNNVSGAIIVSNRKNIEISKIIPRNIILGIGCKKDTKKEDILNAVKDALEKYNLEPDSVKRGASAWLKKDEKGLTEAFLELGKELIFFSKEEILELEGIIHKESEFVKSQTGVSAVSEPCAYLASDKNGRFLARKLVYSGITISIYEESDRTDGQNTETNNAEVIK